MGYTKQDFFSGKIGCRCDTREQYDALMQKLERKGKRWQCGELPTDPRCGHYFAPGVCILLDADTRCKHFVYRHTDQYMPCGTVPFTDLFPADPWSEFLAGKCYICVTRAEWDEFARRCEAHSIRWPDIIGDTGRVNGTYTGVIKASDRSPSFTGPAWQMFVDDNPKWPGTLNCGEHGQRTQMPIYPFSAVLAAEKPTPTHPHILITTDGRVTTATLYEDGRATKEAKATRSPEDKFDANLGAMLALSRLMPGTCALISPGRLDTARHLLDSAAEALKEVGA